MYCIVVEMILSITIICCSGQLLVPWHFLCMSLELCFHWMDWKTDSASFYYPACLWSLILDNSSKAFKWWSLCPFAENLLYFHSMSKFDKGQVNNDGYRGISCRGDIFAISSALTPWHAWVDRWRACYVTCWRLVKALDQFLMNNHTSLPHWRAAQGNPPHLWTPCWLQGLGTWQSWCLRCIKTEVQSQILETCQCQNQSLLQSPSSSLSSSSLSLPFFKLSAV